MTSEFNELCRVCLTKSENMRYLIDLSSVSCQLISMLSSIVNLQINIEEGSPSYMCVNCEEKLKISFQFQQTSKKSHHVISEYIETPFNNTDHKLPKVNVGQLTLDTTVKEENCEAVDEFSIVYGETDENFIEDENEDQKVTNTEMKKRSTKNKLGQHDSEVVIKLPNINVDKPTLDQNLKEETFETVDEFSIVYRETDENFIDDSNKDENIMIKELKKGSTKNKFSQHDPDIVMNVIKETKLKFYESKECLFCTFTGMNNRALSLHVTRNHGSLKGNWCRQCNKIEENLSDHIKKVHRDELKCSFCDRKCRSSSHLVRHLFYHSDVAANNQCQTCDKRFTSARQLKDHSMIHHIICDVCSGTFLDKQDMLSHLNIHNELKCNICKEMIDTENYNKHVCYTEEWKARKEHQRNIQLDRFCLDCNEDEYSEEHMRTHHSKDDEIKGLCTYCGKQFKNQSYLTIHLRRHTKETPYKCKFCDVATVTRAHLQEHERIHTGEKPYVCTFCGKAFIQRSVLATHLKIHTGRTEQCHLCPKKFCRPSELRNHMRKHTGEKPYVCNYCERTFIQKSHLTEHVKIHTDDRPFKCHLCDKAFKQSGTLKGHLNIHEGKNVYKCEICSYTCKKRYTLTVHIRQHQKTDNPEHYKCTICDESFPNEETLIEHGNRNNHENIEIVCDNSENMKYDEYLEHVKI